MKFVKNTRYYTGVVYEWNLPTGWTCPFAEQCLVKVDKETGKFQNKSKEYRCYAANAERFPAVRNHRWKNFEYVKNGGKPIPPKDALDVRIHASGDFFSQEYFDTWIEVCKEHPNVNFWAFTKSLPYWIARLEDIPANLVLTASYGGRHDRLVAEYDLKHTIVFADKRNVPVSIPIDTNDDYARCKKTKVFALLDNFKYKKKNE
jgi:hypothetical protein